MLLCLLLSFAAHAEDAPLTEDALKAMLTEAGLAGEELDNALAYHRERAAFVEGLSYDSGTIEVGNGMAKLDLGQDFAFLDGNEANEVLMWWGNPPSGTVPMGMVLPAGMGPFDDEAWAVLLTYTDDGHVSDEDASSIDFGEMLSEMQADAEASNTERVELGYEPVHLMGWAEPPHYDASTRKLYWAKDLAFGEDRTLNYDIRVLGREGVMELSAIASLDALEPVRAGMQDLLPRVTFNEGHRYEDFDASIDKVAAYGIGALVAGKLAAKAGFFKVLLAMLLAGKKFVMLAVVGLFAGLNSLFGRKSEEDDQ